MQPPRALLIVALVASVAACGDQTGPAPAAELSSARSERAAASVLVCHQPDQGANLIEVAAPAVTAHLEHGDYIARFEVDPQTEPDPTGVRHRRITDALDAARSGRIARHELRSAACRVTIRVAAGEYTGSFDAGAAPGLERLPLLVDVPDLTLVGAFRMEVDAEGRATGMNRDAGGATVLRPNRRIAFLPVTEALIVVLGHPDGSSGDGATIEGLVLGGAPTAQGSDGMGIIGLRVDRLVVRGNRFEGGLSTAADLRATSAEVLQNYGSALGLNCGFCLAGPGTYLAEGNRLVNGALGGLYVAAALAHMPFSLGVNPGAVLEPYELPASANVSATILNNDVRGHLRKPIGFALRILGLGPSSSAVQQSTRVFLGGNDFVHNTFGVIIDAGFPQAGTLRRGDVEVAMSGNTVSESCQNDLLVAFTRHTGALGLTTNPFMVSSTYRLDLGEDLPWDEAWYSHPDGNGNTLIVDGAPVAPGQRTAYDAARTCP